jgi:hypothetical protein
VRGIRRRGLSKKKKESNYLPFWAGNPHHIGSPERQALNIENSL